MPRRSDNPEKIKNMYLNENKSIQEIADILNLQYSTVVTIIAKQGWSKHEKRTDSKDIIKICLKLFYSGIKKRDISTITNCDTTSVYNYTNKYYQKKYSLDDLKDINIDEYLIKYDKLIKSKEENTSNEKTITEQKIEEVEVEPNINSIEDDTSDEKPYEVLYDNYVIYKGKMCEILSKDDLRDLLYPLLVRKPRKKGRKPRRKITSV